MEPQPAFSSSSLEQAIEDLLQATNGLQSYLQSRRPAALPEHFYRSVEQAADFAGKVQVQARQLEEERQDLNALAQIGQVVNSSLELDTVLQIVMDTIIRLTGAERGFLMLRDHRGDLTTRIARNWEQESLVTGELAVSTTVIERVAQEGIPVLTTNAKEDPRFNSQDSVILHRLRSILCVPLRVKSELTGVIYADNRIRSGLFTHKQLELLSGFANHAAVAIENARLFESVRRTLAEVTELQNLMSSVFSSMASGVLTADLDEHITFCNPAIQHMLKLPQEQILKQKLLPIIATLSPALVSEVKRVLETGKPAFAMEIGDTISGQGHVEFRISIAPLKDLQQVNQGFALVIDDLTEQKKLEAQRRLFERMVSPAVIAQLDPDSLRLGGTRQEITVLYADIRGFTRFSEQVSPEALVMVLNQHLAVVADAILSEEGTIDKFLGDAVMAWYNAPIEQEDHIERALRSAVAIQARIQELHYRLEPEFRLAFGVGIHTGEAVLGLVGTQRRLEYTAIGDCVNTARRIQESCQSGQILISDEVFQRCGSVLRAVPANPVQAKGKSAPIHVHRLFGLIN